MGIRFLLQADTFSVGTVLSGLHITGVCSINELMCRFETLSGAWKPPHLFSCTGRKSYINALLLLFLFLKLWKENNILNDAMNGSKRIFS